MYTRVIPRDLFNEADLLKCLARLWIALDERRDHAASLAYVDDDAEGGAFEVEQDPSDGAITVANLPLTVNGAPLRLYRPLNTRSAWPLWCQADDDDVRVFDDHGALSEEFLALIRTSD